MEMDNHRNIQWLKKSITIGLFLLMPVAFAACYSKEERALVREYKSQAEINAVDYVKDKYGFMATVKSASVQKGGRWFDALDPIPTKVVFVTMKYGGEEFTVKTFGDRPTAEGFDNYQQEEILAALKEELDTLTGVVSEDVFVAYGDELAYNVTEVERNGLVAQYFDGKNLKEIFTGNHVTTDVSASYINQEIENFDVERIMEQTGINQLLFVDYDSKDSYDTILKSRDSQKLDTHRNLPYVNEYLDVYSGETKYVGCEKKMVDGVLFVTEYPEETVTVEKKTGFSDNFSKKNVKLVSDVYSLNTESDIVFVFMPVEQLSLGRDDRPRIVVQEAGEEEYTSAFFTDDGKYVGVQIYMRDHEDAVEFAAYVPTGKL